MLGELESSYRALEHTTLSSEQEIAVIDETHLSTLDRKLLPSDGYETYSSLGDTHVPFPELHIFPSATAIVSAIVDQIDPDTADRFGIVLAEGSLYSALIESALEAREIPYRGGPGFEDDEDVRAFFRLLEATFSGSDQRVADIRPVLTTAGINLSKDIEEQRVDSLGPDQLGAYVEFQEAVDEGTLRDVVSVYESISDTRLSELRRELQNLGIVDNKVTEDRVSRFRYYLDAFTVPTDGDTTDGVLLADATSTAYVDRPVVFYVGLGPEWAQSPPDYPWIDREAYLERDLERFERLLQNGTQRYYFVQETQAGSDVTPCVYLRRLRDEPFDSFGDLPHTRYGGHTTSALTSPFPEPDDPPTPPQRRETISQSRLKTLANSPRDAYFDRLVQSPSSVHMVRGTLLHEAAEIYVADPSILEDQRGRVLDAMCERLNPYLGNSKQAVQRTYLEVGLDAITAYLDENPPAEGSYETYDHRDHENELATELGVECDSQRTERWFASRSIGVHGYIDLIQSETSIVDYKTGNKKDASDILKSASIDPVDEYPNFQALVYLAKHREEQPDERLDLHFVHLLDGVDETLTGSPPDPADLVTTVTYVPATFSEFVASRDTFESVTDYADSNKRCRALHPLGYEAYRDFFETHELPRAGDDPERRATITEEFVAYAQERVGEYKYVRQGCEKVIEDLDDVPTGYVLQSDLDAFEAFVDEQLEALNEYRNSRFPVAYREDGPTWDRVDHRDLILTDR
ncbi:PD-(D/E)XK nuclease family protein [Natrialbaceae archaeon A-gly3]